MTYTVNANRVDDYLWAVVVEVLDEGQNVVLRGETTVACETEQEATDYAERVFLPDLRLNYPRQIGGLVLSWEEVE